ncbi:hypothetical protein MHH28_07755 [Paenibacillus sp. FSL K6-1217]|uniref:hypothetical protein n=1 Tax=Paenibacillus sp. FSL K6-1217 TaxID=2921466 RepID=UPI0032518F50
MKLIDADKLKRHVLANWEMERYAETGASEYRAEVWGELYQSLQSEMFDPTPPVQPDTEEYRIKVRHKTHPSWGIGVVTKIANGGRRMICEFPNAPEYNGGYLYANKLEVIK